MQEQSDLGPIDFVGKPVRIIVCGSRSWSDWETFESTLGRIVLFYVTLGASEVVLVHGACPFGGADAMADRFAHENQNLPLIVERHPPKSNNAVGFLDRNQDMADLGARLCIGFTNGRDPGTNKWGTGDMFSRALAAGISVRGVPSMAQAVRGHQARSLSSRGR